MDDWFDGFDYESDDPWSTGDWDNAWDYGQGNDGGDMSGMGYDWDSIFGGSGSDSGGSSGTGNGSGINWMNLLLSGTSSYLGARETDKQNDKNRQGEIALTILRDQLQNKEYDRRQGQLSDAYKGFQAAPEGNGPRPISLLSGAGYPNANRLQGAGYYGG